jgi:hypothetical protein
MTTILALWFTGSLLLGFVWALVGCVLGGEGSRGATRLGAGPGFHRLTGWTAPPPLLVQEIEMRPMADTRSG